MGKRKGGSGEGVYVDPSFKKPSRIKSFPTLMDPLADSGLLVLPPCGCGPLAMDASFAPPSVDADFRAQHKSEDRERKERRKREEREKKERRKR